MKILNIKLYEACKNKWENYKIRIGSKKGNIYALKTK